MSEGIKLKCPYCGSDEFKREYAHKWASQKVVNLIHTVCTATTSAAADNIRDVIVSDSGYVKKYIYHCYVCNALINPLEDLL